MHYSDGTRTLLQLAVALGLFLWPVNEARSQSAISCIYSNGQISPLGLPRGAFAFGINDTGEVTGGMGNSDCFILSHGRLSTFTPPDSEKCAAYGINQARSIVGWYLAGAHGQLGFLYAGGKTTVIKGPNCFSTSADAINNKGQIVGSCNFSGEARVKTSGFLLDATGTFSVISVPGASSTSPVGIDDDGRIVGVFYTPVATETIQSFLYSHGTFEIFRNAFCSTLQVHGISSDGVITGSCLPANTTTYKSVDFVLDTRSSSFKTVAPQNGAGIGATGINARGQLVGMCQE
jgi:uncharacterized membrane protein